MCVFVGSFYLVVKFSDVVVIQTILLIISETSKLSPDVQLVFIICLKITLSDDGNVCENAKIDKHRGALCHIFSRLQ